MRRLLLSTTSLGVTVSLVVGLAALLIVGLRPHQPREPLPSPVAMQPTSATATRTATGTSTPPPAPVDGGQGAGPLAPALTPTPTRTPIPSLNPTPLPQDGTVTAPTPPPAAPVVHVVTQGETLYRIATRYGVSIEAVAAANQLADVTRIQVGQSLVIPGITGGQSMPLAVPVTGDGMQAAPTLPPPLTLRGIPMAQLIVMPPQVAAHVREIYARGQTLGRNPRAFSKTGDSTIENPHFMDRFDSGPYVLGDYAYLQPTVEHYRGSFARDSVAVRVALHSWSVMDPMWAPRPPCAPAETMLACEFRLHNPSVLIVRLGSNDKGVPQYFEDSLRAVIEFSLAQGVIPLIGTKADRFDGPHSPNNAIMRRLAEEYRLPLWDFDLIAGTLPGRGLGPDAVHMTSFYAHDWTSPVAWTRGHGVHSLTGLMALDALRLAVVSGAESGG